MRSATLGHSGPEISRIGIGAWQASGSGPWGFGPGSDDEAVTAAIRRAVERGVTWVDTAASYGLGHSEEVVRRALEPWKVGEDVLVFTKCAHPWEPPDRIWTELTPASIRRECEGSLRRLGVERIDLYQFHHPDPATPVEDSWAAMGELVLEGKVRWAGVSNFDVSLLDRCEAIAHVDSLQPELNLLRREALREVIPWSRAHGTGVIVYSPLATGILAGSHDLNRLLGYPENDWRHAHAGRIVESVGRLAQLAERLGAEPARLAIGWALAASGVTGAIVGARTPDQVDAWAEAAHVDLPAEVLAEVGAIFADGQIGRGEGRA
jgi:aryl-alcohol dehydrogenase-like predicted oxidoreductase